MLSGDVLSQWLQRRHGTVVQGPLVSLSRGGLLRVLETGSRPVQVVLPVVHGGQAAVVRAVDHTGAHLALRVQAVSSAEEKSRQMERLVNMTTVAVAARERPERFPAVLPVVESFVLVVPGHEIAVTGGEPEYELWCDLMPWCPGDLNGWAKATPLATRHPGAVLAAFVPLLATVRAVHEDLGIVHRDITPNNVLVDAQGRLLLADWGIAHAIAAHQTSTYTQLVGNRGFSLPPEMLAGDPSVGRYTDAWYLGSLLSWMLTDQPPGPQHGPTWLPPGLPGGPVGQQVQAVVRGLCWPDARARMDLAQAQTLLVEAAAGRASVTGPVSPAPGVVGPGASGTAVMPRPGAPAAAMRHPGTNPTAPYAHTTAQPANRGHGPLVVTSVADAPTKRRGVRGLVVAGLVVTLVLLGGLGWGIFALLGPEAPADARPGSTAPDTHTPGTQPGTGSGNDDPSRVDPGGSDAGRGLFYSATTLQQIADDFVAAAGGPQVLSMMVYSGYAMAYAPLEPGSTKFDEYTWRDGKVTHKPAPSQPKPADVPKMLFDLTTVDWSVVESLVATVAARVPEESVTYVWAHRPGTLFTTYSTVFTHGITTTTMFSVATSGDYNSSGFHADARGKLVD